MSTSYTKEHLEDALTWVERNVHDGIRIVAGALSATYPEDEPTPRTHLSGCDYPDACAHPSHGAAVEATPSTVQDVASAKAEEVNAQFPGTEVLVLVVDGDIMRVGACMPEPSPERVKEILTNALALLEKQG